MDPINVPPVPSPSLEPFGELDGPTTPLPQYLQLPRSLCETRITLCLSRTSGADERDIPSREHKAHDHTRYP
ncbi:hypothetical protein GQ607_002913 [Colletotrichum asianum]|uniref:Uncharacterized protein n=1 Tax=Colletotrichum asianum TaxID=702518 RepID=A0A8H3ZY86_9PEZI|nr:hypothetical protein GQ607_002913 [Colletotrichum asianum]